ncbi:DNA-dependent ATPase fun30, partial [Dispira parvispora]
ATEYVPQSQFRGSSWRVHALLDLCQNTIHDPPPSVKSCSLLSTSPPSVAQAHQSLALQVNVHLVTILMATRDTGATKVPTVLVVESPERPSPSLTTGSTKWSQYLEKFRYRKQQNQLHQPTLDTATLDPVMSGPDCPSPSSDIIVQSGPDDDLRLLSSPLASPTRPGTTASLPLSPGQRGSTRLLSLHHYFNKPTTSRILGRSSTTAVAPTSGKPILSAHQSILGARRGLKRHRIITSSDEESDSGYPVPKLVSTATKPTGLPATSRSFFNVKPLIHTSRPSKSARITSSAELPPSGAIRTVSRNLSNKSWLTSDSESESDSTAEEALEVSSSRYDPEADIVRFFNTATMTELQTALQCSPEASQVIVTKLRPFTDMDQLRAAFRKNKSVSIAMVNYYEIISHGYRVVDQVIAQCERMAKKLQMAIGDTDPLGIPPSSTLPSPPCSVATLSTNSPTNNDWLLTQQPANLSDDFTLKNYQLFGVSWLRLLYQMNLSGILADEMGLGKTAQVIAFLGQLLHQGNEGPHLVIVPTSTLENWMREFKKFCPSLRVVSYYGNQSERANFRMDWKEAKKRQRETSSVLSALGKSSGENSGCTFKPSLSSDESHDDDDDDDEDVDSIAASESESDSDTQFTELPHVLVTTYNVSTGHKYDRLFLRNISWRTLILDEGHMIKNCCSARYQHLMALQASFRLLLTGTPLQNNLRELISLLSFILPRIFKNKFQVLQKVFSLPSNPAGVKGNHRGKSSGRKAQSDASETEPPPSSPLPSLGEDNSDTASVTSQSSAAPSTLAGQLSAERVDRAKRLLLPFVLRRRKDQVLKDLPSKHQHLVKVELTAEQRQFYDQIVQKYCQDKQDTVDLAKLRRCFYGEWDGMAPNQCSFSLDAAFTTDEEAPKKAKNSNQRIMSILMKLRKISIHPMLERSRYTDDQLRIMSKAILKVPEHCDANPDYVFEDMQVMNDFELDQLCRKHQRYLSTHCLPKDALFEAGKVQQLEKQLADSQSRGDRILLFSQFTSMLDILEHVLQARGYQYCRLDGACQATERQGRIDEYNNNPDILVFLLSTKACGVGINLTSANVVILFDIDYNPHNDKQAEDRAHRVGQLRDVHVYKYVAQATVEEYMLATALEKLKLDESVSRT